MYTPRFYRKMMGERYRSFTYKYLETDIWVAFDRDTDINVESVENFVSDKCHSLRLIIDDYINSNPDFQTSYTPIKISNDMPIFIKRLSESSQITEVGPMAGIAGLFSEEIGRSCKQHFGFNEIIVENGGDNYIDVKHSVTVNVFAGDHPLSNKIVLQVEAKHCPMGICASSGKFGHSKSFGSADLVTVACKDTVLADQYATALANKINKADDIENVLKIVDNIPEILHLSVFKDGAFGIRGKLKVKTL